MRPRVLVVDDEESLTTLLQYNLEKEGFEVAVAGSGEEALRQVDLAAPDLLLLDWMLPAVSGLEVCRRVRARADMRHVAVVMLTGRTEEGDRVAALNFGADDYICKPFGVLELAARLRAVLRRVPPEVAGEGVQWGDIADPTTVRSAGFALDD
jgi:two-component system, OmpR family, phosphate regulon response regulator PhoB